MTRFFIAPILAILSLPVAAQTIYKCLDENGGTLIAATRLDKSCKPVVNAETSAPPSSKAPRASAAPTPASFPKVQEDTQKARDGDRRHILTQELAGEQRSLDQARKDLADQESLRPGGDNRERLAPYKDRVAQHERNLQAIQKELSNLR